MQKPLPPPPPLLSTAGSAHLRAFAQHALADEGLGADWAPELVRALDELGAALQRGAWLAGLRRRAEASVPAEEARASHSSTSASETPEPEDDDTRRRRELGAAVSRADDAPAAPAHLLLAAAPWAGALVRTRAEPELDYVAARIGCAFAPGVFALAPGGALSGPVLFGLDNWRGACLPRGTGARR
jgi:hypothetical protein